MNYVFQSHTMQNNFNSTMLNYYCNYEKKEQFILACLCFTVLAINTTLCSFTVSVYMYYETTLC